MVLATGAYVVAVTALGWAAFDAVAVEGFDFGIQVHSIWRIKSWASTFSTVRGMATLGDHLWFVHYLLAPFYALFPTPKTLLLLQAMAHGGAALFVYRFAARRASNGWTAAALACGWLMHPALWNMNLESFHPETLAVFFLVACVDAADTGRWRLFWVTAVLAALCKEDVALSLVGLSPWLWRRSPRRGWLLAALAAGWFALSLLVLLRLFNGTGFFRTTGGYWFSAWSSHRWEPAYYLGLLTVEANRQYLIDLLTPMLGLFLLSPRLALAALPSLLINLLSYGSSNGICNSIRYHYNNQTLPFLWLAAAEALPRLPRLLRGGRRQLGLGLVVVAVGVCWNHRLAGVPLSRVVPRLRSLKGGAARGEQLMTAARRWLTPDAKVSLDFWFVPQLGDREYAYGFPNPWLPKWWGIAYGRYGPEPRWVPDFVILWNKPRSEPKQAELLARLKELEGVVTLQEDSVLVLRIDDKLAAARLATTEPGASALRTGAQ